MSGNLQYVVDNNQKIMLAHCACWPLVFHKHRLQCRCIFLVAILTDWIQMTKKAFATKKLSSLSVMRLEFQNLFQACMHMSIKLWQFSLFLFLPVSFSSLLFACLHLREVSTQISREVNNSTKQKKVLMTAKITFFSPSVSKAAVSLIIFWLSKALCMKRDYVTGGLRTIVLLQLEWESMA